VIPTETVHAAGLTEDDARFYGVCWRRHLSGTVSNGAFPETANDEHSLCEAYLAERGIHFWRLRAARTTDRSLASGRGVVRDGTTAGSRRGRTTMPSVTKTV